MPVRPEPNASQDVVFNLSAKEVLMSALDGYSGCVLCYGQTGAGKTFTMTGALFPMACETSMASRETSCIRTRPEVTSSMVIRTPAWGRV